ncbi:phage portal protein [Methylobrevis albus]|uniref:Phage portal protein n=1 Tax=Methylobrevis albus TaxID=2793297 RepID=A0A931I013_9HYPH|nr:phage portal protein [Methylobrevis albus]MBH0237615.1 phage portal protein [Methylobrevis albus]
MPWDTIRRRLQRPARSTAPAEPAPTPLGPAEAKASRTAALIAFAQGGRPVWTARDYAPLIREGFTRNPVVYRAVRLVAEAAASVPLVLTEGAEEPETHPLRDLLARPNAGEAGADFMEALFGHLLLAGNAYVECVAVEGRPAELHALRPDRIKVVAGSDGWPAGYDYSVGGRTVRFRDGDGTPPLLHLKLFHPLDDHYGFAPLEAAQVGLDVHNAAAAWNKALLDNAARPSGALVYRGEGGLSDEQFERLKRELADGFQGAGNAGRPLLLEGGLDWTAMSLSPQDMDFMQAKNAAARDVALAFGVPPMLLGIPGDATYANYAEANRAFWRQTVLPLCQRVAAALAAWLGPLYGQGISLRVDLDQVPALGGERQELWQRVMAADFLTVNEKRAAVGYAPVEDGDRLPAGGGREPKPEGRGWM